MPEVVRFVRGDGSGGFMAPPGDPSLFWSVWTYSSNRPNARCVAIASVSYAADPASGYPQSVQDRAREIIDGAQRVESPLWVAHVYGYFHDTWSPDGAERDTGKFVYGPRPNGPDGEPIPLAWHAGVLMIREYFPQHQPRADLIADPGRGYGSWPCSKCGEKVQYEPRDDALAVVNASLAGGKWKWTRNPRCADGGRHEW